MAQSKNIGDKRPCSRCKELKPLSEFSKRSDRGGQYQPHCKACDKYKTIVYRDNLREKVLQKYARNSIIECEICGENDVIVLTLDHINRDGNKERSEYGHYMQAYYRRLLEEDRDDIRILCRNCNLREHMKHNRRNHNKGI